MSQRLLSISIQVLMSIYLSIYKIICLVFNNHDKIEKNNYEILLTGTFFSSNWLSAHIVPLSLSTKCKKIVVVTSLSYDQTDKVKVVHPNAHLCKIIGDVPARMITFAYYAILHKPDIVGGFHLLFNGLFAAIIARLIGAYSLYFCVGGPAEVINGGLKSENRIFSKMKRPNIRVENQLLEAISKFDIVITMGNGAIRYFKGKGIQTKMCMIQGGLDIEKFRPDDTNKEYDIIFVGRLVPIKQLHILMEIIRGIKKNYTEIRLVVIGDGPLGNGLKIKSIKEGLGKNIIFPGHKNNVEKWYKKSKVFVLTSETEGLSLAMMEAIACGLPVVVPRVGDLQDMVQNNVNGFLIENHCIEDYSNKIKELLFDQKLYNYFSESALKKAATISHESIAEKWNKLLSAR